jgi:hypothetical protein
MQVYDFVVVQTHVVVLPLGASVAYPTVLNSSLLTKWSNENQRLNNQTIKFIIML